MDVQGFLGVLRSRLRRVLMLDGLARLVAVVLVACIAAVAIDYCWPIPGPARLVLLVAIAAALLALIHRQLLRPLARTMDDRAMAQLAERRLPELDGRLLTQVDGIELGGADGQTLAAVLTPAAVTGLVPAHALPRRVAVAAALLLAIAGIGLGFPRFFHDGFNRLFFPLGATEWERHSALDGGLERTVVAADEPLVVRVQRTKGKDAPLRLSWVAESGGTVEHRMLSGLTGPWHQAVTLPAGRYRLLAESSDALPLTMRGWLVKRPLLTRVAAVLTPPAYTKLAPQQLATLGCTALPGSRLDFTIEFALDADREVVDAGIMLGDSRLDTTRTATGLRGAFMVSKGGVLAVQLKDQDGIGPSPEPRFTVVLAEDRKPVVSLDGPRAKEAVTARAEVYLAVDASDDYGLATLQLVSQVSNDEKPADGAAGSPKVVTRPPVAGTPFADVKGLTSTTRKTVIAVGELAKEGDRLVMIGRATDANDVTGPGIGESQPLELRVVSENELRQEFDRLLGEARDRVVQARDEIAQGLAKPDKLIGASRGAALAATRAGETLAQVVRRWNENKLPGDQIAPAAKAEDLVDNQALARLAEAMKGQDQPARAADVHLAEAEKLLAGMLQEGDLTRLLASAIEREKSLNQESRTFVRDYLTKPLDDAAKARQANLAGRQKEIAEQVKEIERRILSSSSKQLEKAQELVRGETPADQLQQASANLGSDSQRAQSIPHQETALATLNKILDQLRGSDAAGDLAKKAGELAARQEHLVKQLEEGANPKDLAAEQKKLKEETEQFGKQLNDKQQGAAKAVAAAAQSQQEAAKGMDGGDRSSAAREGSAAASLLREAQKQLGGDEDKDKDDKKDKDKKSADVLALLKELKRLQTSLVADSTQTFQRLGDKPLDFAAQRDVPALAERESDILLRLQEEGLKELDQMPIVVASINRVAAALTAAATHLATPALGEKGMRLEKIALYEISRLIDIAENLPPPEQKGGGKGGGGGNQAPFPPGAELALLAAMEEELAALTAAGRPVDLAAMQLEVDKLVQVLAGASRPGSRPSLLLQRAHRAMETAADLLHGGDRGLTTRHEEAAAEDSLRRLMAEAKAGGGGGKGNNNQPQQKPQKGGAPSPPNQQNSGGGASAGGNAGSTPAPNQPHDATVLAGGLERGEFMNLTPEKREQLKQAREQHLPPGALPIFERYLELLEENK